MSSGGLLLLLGLLTLWAELTPISGQDRPEFCYLPADPGPCRAKKTRFYYNSDSKQCEKFTYDVKVTGNVLGSRSAAVTHAWLTAWILSK
ncbi:putative Kunitz-BPTI-like toxin protein, partial [Naja naja]